MLMRSLTLALQLTAEAKQQQVSVPAAHSWLWELRKRNITLPGGREAGDTCFPFSVFNVPTNLLLK